MFLSDFHLVVFGITLFISQSSLVLFTLLFASLTDIFMNRFLFFNLLFFNHLFFFGLILFIPSSVFTLLLSNRCRFNQFLLFIFLLFSELIVSVLSFTRSRLGFRLGNRPLLVKDIVFNTDVLLLVPNRLLLYDLIFFHFLFFLDLRLLLHDFFLYDLRLSLYLLKLFFLRFPEYILFL